MIDGLFQGGALPTLERLVQFTEARHRVLANDIANLSTPGFKPQDLSVASFQAALRDAQDRRRSSADAAGGPLSLADTADLGFTPNGLDVQPQDSNENILFHDQNNRDLDRLMQHLAENTITHNMGIEFLRSELAILRTAIRGSL